MDFTNTLLRDHGRHEHVAFLKSMITGGVWRESARMAA